jgi:hypothetical protein
MTATIVAEGAAHVFGNAGHIGKEFAGAGCFEASAFEGGAYFSDVSLMMLGVMDLHGAGIEVRFERVVAVGEFG